MTEAERSAERRFKLIGAVSSGEAPQRCRVATCFAVSANLIESAAEDTRIAAIHCQADAVALHKRTHESVVVHEDGCPDTRCLDENAGWAAMSVVRKDDTSSVPEKA
jgi:hypothetical protein